MNNKTDDDTTGVVNGVEKAPVPLTTEADDIGEINNISTEGNRRKTYLYGKVESSQKSCLKQKIMVDSGNTLRGGTWYKSRNA